MSNTFESAYRTRLAPHPQSQGAAVLEDLLFYEHFSLA